MSRILYTRGLKEVNFASDTIRVLLERSTSTYSPDRDHDYVDDLTNLVEITVASYARKTIGGAAANLDDTKDQVEFDGNDVEFGNLEAGQTVLAAIAYKQVGGDDSTPEDDVLLWYDDGKIDVVLAADASLNDTLIWVEPIEADIPNGTALDFGGGATCTTDAPASRGDRSLSVTAIAAGATAGDTSESATDSILPAVLQNGPFNYQAHADGYYILTQRGLFAT